jgi:DNA-binding LacI/PurR family transcriptional regulator
LIRRGERFDGVVVSDYVMAIAAVKTLRAAGITVPGDVSVVGFGDAPEAEAAGLTTVAAAITELGACAARQLIAQINGLRISGMTTLSVRLAIRET